MKGVVYLFFFVFLFSVMNCTDSTRRDLIKEDMVREGVEKFRKEKEQKCQEQAYKEADRLVDSMMLDKAFYSKIDSFVKPYRPIKPDMPLLRDMKDQDPIGPVLDNGEL